MPFKSAKQKKTIDAAAHNPAFAKKVGIKTGDAKKMSAHGKGQTKFEEAKDTVEKDEKGNVKSWKHEGDWKKADNKQGRGKVTNLSDKARRQTAKMSKAETEMAEAFEQALEGAGSPTVTHGPNKGKKWSPETPGPTNPSYKSIDKGIPSPPDGATAPPPGYKPPKPSKRAEVTPTSDSDDTAMTAESSSKKVMKKLRAKHMMESIKVLGELIAEAKKSAKKKSTKVKEDPNEGNAFGKAVQDAKKDGIQKGEKVKVGGKEYPVKEAANEKCNHTPKGKKCPVHGLKECGSMYEGNDGNLANNETFMPVNKEKPQGPVDKAIGNVTKAVGGAIKTVADKVKGATGDTDVKTDESYTVNGKKVSKAAYDKEMKKAGKGKEKVKEGWTHDTLAARLFESGDEYMVSLHNRLSQKIKG